ncbi:MAG: family 16 glycosylhydrolase [Verrucomicrobiota bacterium]
MLRDYHHFLLSLLLYSASGPVLGAGPELLMILADGVAAPESVPASSAQPGKDQDRSGMGFRSSGFDLSGWKLVWRDEFDGSEEDLDARWESQNGPSGHILCSRWRENVSVSNGTLKLTNRKEKRGGQEWTSGSIWTREQFRYGYYECRYRYATAPATNNSFWLMTLGPDPEKGKRFEIDINEGHYPSEVNTNIHNWTDITTREDGSKSHPSDSETFPFGVSQDRVVQLEIPVSTRRIRLVSEQVGRVNIGEFQIFGVSDSGYPDIMKSGDSRPGLFDFVKDAGTTISVSGHYKPDSPQSMSVLKDGNPNTAWSSNVEGPKSIEFVFDEPRTVGCVQFSNGWKGKEGLGVYLTEYRLEYFDGKKWVDMSTFNLAEGEFDFSRDFHTYGLEWNEDEIIFYFNGQELRREKNEFAHGPSPIWLSLAIISWSGEVTDAIDGTSMEVDYVRYYQKKDRG